MTEDWFAGLWSYSEDCSEQIRFDANGDFVTPAGEQGTWSIENVAVPFTDGKRQLAAVANLTKTYESHGMELIRAIRDAGLECQHVASSTPAVR